MVIFQMVLLGLILKVDVSLVRYKRLKQIYNFQCKAVLKEVLYI